MFEEYLPKGGNRKSLELIVQTPPSFFEDDKILKALSKGEIYLSYETVKTSITQGKFFKKEKIVEKNLNKIIASYQNTNYEFELVQQYNGQTTTHKLIYENQYKNDKNNFSSGSITLNKPYKRAKKRIEKI